MVTKKTVHVPVTRGTREKLEGSRLIKGKIQEKGKQSLMSKGVPYY